MADRVQKQLEDIVPELQLLVKLEIFNRDEIKKIIKTYRKYEFDIISNNPQLSLNSFKQYLLYNFELDNELQNRWDKRPMSIRVSSRRIPLKLVIRRKIHNIFKRCTKRFINDISLWHLYIEYCYKVKSYKVMDRIIMDSLSKNPNAISLWLLLASYTLKYRGIISSRNIIQQGLRILPENLSLYIYLLELEIKSSYEQHHHDDGAIISISTWQTIINYALKSLSKVDRDEKFISRLADYNKFVDTIANEMFTRRMDIPIFGIYIWQHKLLESFLHDEINSNDIFTELIHDSLNHPSIIPLLAAFINNTLKYVITEKGNDPSHKYKGLFNIDIIGDDTYTSRCNNKGTTSYTSNRGSPAESFPLEVQSTSLPLSVEPSSNSLPVHGNATPGDRGGEKGSDGSSIMGMMEDGAKDVLDVTSSGEPAADLREAEGEVNREADGRNVTSGGDDRNVISDGEIPEVYGLSGDEIFDMLLMQICLLVNPSDDFDDLCNNSFYLRDLISNRQLILLNKKFKIFFTSIVNNLILDLNTISKFINQLYNPYNSTTEVNSSLPEVQSNSLFHSPPLEVQSTSLPLSVEPSSNSLPVHGNATPGDRGVNPEEQEMSTRKNVDVQPLRTGIIPGGTKNINPEEQTSSGKPESDPRELEGEVNREGSTPSGNTSGGEADGRTSTGTPSGKTSEGGITNFLYTDRISPLLKLLLYPVNDMGICDQLRLVYTLIDMGIIPLKLYLSRRLLDDIKYDGYIITLLFEDISIDYDKKLDILKSIDIKLNDYYILKIINIILLNPPDNNKFIIILLLLLSLSLNLLDYNNYNKYLLYKIMYKLINFNMDILYKLQELIINNLFIEFKLNLIIKNYNLLLIYISWWFIDYYLNKIQSNHIYINNYSNIIIKLNENIINKIHKLNTNLKQICWDKYVHSAKIIEYINLQYNNTSPITTDSILARAKLNL